jgi:hypothetical protein
MPTAKTGESILASGETSTRIGGAITEGDTAIMDDVGISTDAMTGIATGVMFDMTTAAIITNRRFGRTSKIFGPLARAYDKTARTFVVPIKN